MARSHAPHSGTTPLWRRPGAWIAALALVLNANTLTHSWALDDSLLITQNELTRKGIAGIPEIWSTDVFTGYFGKGGVEQGGRYRPLSQSVFAICHDLFGATPFPGHLVNVLLYALTCLLLYRFLQEVLPAGQAPPWTNAAFLAAVLYTAHPLHCEVVANIKSLDEVLAMGLSLQCALLLLRWRTERRWWLPVVAGVLFVLALCAKENAITFLAVVPLALHQVRSRVRDMATATAVLLVPAGLYLALRTAVLDPSPELVQARNFLTDPFFGANTAQHLATICLTWWRYIGLLVLPLQLTTDHYPAMIPIVGWSSPEAWAGLLMLAIPGLWALWTLPRRHPAAFGVLFFLATFSVVSNLVIDLGTPLNDRFLFMPLAGYAVAVAWLLSKAQELAAPRGALPVVRGVMLAGLAALSLRTISRNADWKDDLTLFTHDITVSGNSARCNVMTGKLYYEHAATLRDPVTRQQALDKAATHLRRGLEIYRGYYLAWGILGIMEMDRGRDREAAELFIESLRIERTRVALTNLAFVGRRMFQNKDLAGARRALETLRSFDPAQPDPYLLIADMQMRSGHADSALMQLDRLVALAPSNADAHRMRGEVLGAYLARPVEAEAAFVRALELAPRNVTVLDNLGVAAFQRGDKEAALQRFLQAAEIEPGNAHILLNVARTYGLMGNEAMEQEYMRRSQAAGGTP